MVIQSDHAFDERVVQFYNELAARFRLQLGEIEAMGGHVSRWRRENQATLNRFREDIRGWSGMLELRVEDFARDVDDSALKALAEEIADAAQRLFNYTEAATKRADDLEKALGR